MLLLSPLACANFAKGDEAEQQHRIANTVAEQVSRTEPQYLCADNADRTQCPSIATLLGRDHLDVAIPADARWILQGPSYIQEIFATLVEANGGCDRGDHDRKAASFGLRALQAAKFDIDPTNDESSHHSQPIVDPAALLPPREESSGHPCVLPNGAVLAYLEGESVPGWVTETEMESRGYGAWTHAVFMQPHNEEYRMEHERAAAERDEVDPVAFADADGKDMCLPQDVIYQIEAYNGTEASFDAYVACLAAKVRQNATSSYSISGLSRLLRPETKLSVVVPWHVERPANLRIHLQGAGVDSIEWRDLAAGMKKTLPYFTRDRVVEYDCRAKQVLKPVQDPASGFKERDISRAEENMADQQHPGVMDHQCVAVCIKDEDASWYPGSIIWMAHDLVELIRNHTHAGHMMP